MAHGRGRIRRRDPPLVRQPQRAHYVRLLRADATAGPGHRGSHQRPARGPDRRGAAGGAGSRPQPAPPHGQDHGAEYRSADDRASVRGHHHGSPGLIALVLAVSGVYGLMAYRVSQRTHEIGLRVALGASEKQILALTLGQAGRLTALGVGIGLPLAFALARLMEGSVRGSARGSAALLPRVRGHPVLRLSSGGLRSGATRPGRGPGDRAARGVGPRYPSHPATARRAAPAMSGIGRRTGATQRTVKRQTANDRVAHREQQRDPRGASRRERRTR